MRAISLLMLLAATGLAAQTGDAALRKKIMDMALGFQGVPYVYGAESPTAFDCSGLVHYVYKKAANLDIPRNSRDQYSIGTPIEKDAALPGDVFVFNTSGSGPSHVAINLGNGTMIHAISEGPKTGVVISNLTDRYFGPRMIAARAFLAAPAAQPAPAVTTPKLTAAPSAAATPAAKPAAPAPALSAPPAAAAASPVKPSTLASPPPSPPPAQTPAQAIAPPIAPPRAEMLAASKKPAVEPIGFTVMPEPTVYNDKIPAAIGTALAFTVTNGTGKDGIFDIYFYKANIDFKKTVILRHVRTKLVKGEAQELEPYLFTESGTYRLNVKSGDNDQLLQRVFRVVETPK